MRRVKVKSIIGIIFTFKTDISLHDESSFLVFQKSTKENNIIHNLS